MLFALGGTAHPHLTSWALGPVLQGLERFLDDPQFRTLLIQKPHAFTRPQGLYSLPVTVKTFLTQCLTPDHAYRTAVATAKARGWLPPNASPDTGAYCRACDALAAEGLQRAVEHTAAALEACASPDALWMGRHVRVVDGTGITLPDTPANQDAYPQPSEQQPGCGFPVLRLVAFMSLATGAVCSYTLGSLHEHEQRLFHALRPHLQAGEVVLGARHFGTFANLVLLQRQGVDGVFRRHQARTTEAQTITRLGPEDHLGRWHIRANRYPVWLDPAAA
jgi:hypothetical protein